MGWNAHVKLPGEWKCVVGMDSSSLLSAQAQRFTPAGGWQRCGGTDCSSWAQGPSLGTAWWCRGCTGCCCASGSPASAPGDEQCWPRCRDCPCQPGCPCSRVTVPACATEFTQPLGCPVPPVHSLPARAAAWHCLGKAPGKIWRKSQPADRRELELAAVPAQSKIIPKALKQWYCSCFLCLCVLSADF